MSKLLSREGVARVTTPVARVFLHAGFTADGVTIIATAAAVLAALTLFPIGRLFAGTVVITFFVMFDMVDGAMARESGGGTRFGAVLDATCDRISDGAVFCGLAWWAGFGLGSPSLVVATLICLVTSQVIMLAAASSHIATGSAHGNGNTGRSDNPAPTSTMINRSGRSMKPPSPRSPLASARALM